MNDLFWKTERRKINDLIPFDRNPRRLTEQQFDQLKKSLVKFNVVEIPAIDSDNRIIAGHQRLNVLRLLGRGDEEIDVRVPSRKLTQAEFEEYNLRSNKNTGEWDFDALAGFDDDLLRGIGFTDDDLKIFSVDGIDDPDVKLSEKPQFLQMTFTVHESQIEAVRAAIKAAKDEGCEDAVNENSNGNALVFISKRFLDGREGH